MTAAGVVMLGAMVAAFSSCERMLWRTRLTPFAFVAGPFMAVVVFAAWVGPALGYHPLDLRAVGTTGLFLLLVALASLAALSVRSPQTEPVDARSQGRERGEVGLEHRGVSSIEYLVVAMVLAASFFPDLTSGVPVAKGELGAGSLRSHLVHLGMAYLVLAVAQSRGALIARIALAVLVLWILAFNQVKYLIFLPLAAGLLYRWTTGRISTGMLSVVVIAAPMATLLTVYVFIGAATGLEVAALRPELALDLLRHGGSYLLSGVIGLSRLFEETTIAAFGPDGLAYPFAPALNITRFVGGGSEFMSVVNPLYLRIEESGLLTSNVFTLFGSLLYRGGWYAAVALSLGYSVLGYLVWEDWRRKRDPVAAAAGSFWLAPLFFAWHDPFFMHLSVLEVTVLLWLRSRISR